jgi:hypothetical protein
MPPTFQKIVSFIKKVGFCNSIKIHVEEEPFILFDVTYRSWIINHPHNSATEGNIVDLNDAAIKGDLEAIKAMTQNIKYNIQELTKAFIYSAQNSHLDLVKFFVTTYPLIRSPAMCAHCWERDVGELCGNINIAKFLLSCGMSESFVLDCKYPALYLKTMLINDYYSKNFKHDLDVDDFLKLLCSKVEDVKIEFGDDANFAMKRILFLHAFKIFPQASCIDNIESFIHFGGKYGSDAAVHALEYPEVVIMKKMLAKNPTLEDGHPVPVEIIDNICHFLGRRGEVECLLDFLGNVDS